jgi:Tir chaperone protein (CesT) family
LAESLDNTMLMLETAITRLADELGGTVRPEEGGRFRVEAEENVIQAELADRGRIVLAAILRPKATGSERSRVYHQALRLNAARLRTHGNDFTLSVEDRTGETILWRAMSAQESNETEFLNAAEALLNEVEVWHRYLDSV